MNHHAIVGTGGMANAHARNFAKMKGVTLHAACDIDRKKAEAFAKEYNIPHVYTDLDEMLKDQAIDSVSNVTPDPFHAPLSHQIMDAGKHILCEKPLATNHPDALSMAKAAKRNNVINMVNFSYRDAPALCHIKSMVTDGKLGVIRHVSVEYYQSWLTSDYWGHWKTTDSLLWRLSTDHGSKGTLGDIGVHILDLATFSVGPLKNVQCRLKTFPKVQRNKVKGYKLDANDTALITAEYKNGAMGSISTTRYATGHHNTVTLSIHGTEGGARLDLDESRDSIEVCLGNDRHEAKWKRLKSPKSPTIYQRFIKSIQTGKQDQPDFAWGAEVQKAIDACFESDEQDATIAL